MHRYVAFLRGVSPMNASMPALKACLEDAGFTRVRTILSSGNVAFDARGLSEALLESCIEQAMQVALGRSFYTIVRPVVYLQDLLATDPYACHGVPPQAKRVISFLRTARQPRVALPLQQNRATVLCLRGREVFTAYEPTPGQPVFMRLIEKAFGVEVTTRTWETVARCAAA
ncbi:MAG: DUF1697 domain-containing protein [Proteobacteria bacterium]|nr:DUF1697 domain-containing protein [Pseudomonadota bacterium]